jgi:galactitol-specific phosphotransferase system IIC component
MINIMMIIMRTLVVDLDIFERTCISLLGLLFTLSILFDFLFCNILGQVCLSLFDLVVGIRGHNLCGFCIQTGEEIVEETFPLAER